MSLLMTIRIAFKALGRNKLRTALTMLGMIIGVAAVIAMVALGSGAQNMIEEQVKSAGTNLITISPGSTQAQGVRTGFGMTIDSTFGICAMRIESKLWKLVCSIRPSLTVHSSMRVLAPSVR